VVLLEEPRRGQLLEGQHPELVGEQQQEEEQQLVGEPPLEQALVVPGSQWLLGD